MNNFRVLVRELMPYFLLLFLVFVFFNRLFFPNLSIFVTPDYGQSDLLHGYYPLKFLLWDSLHQNQIPFWTDKIATGYPIFADGQIGAFSIINLILFKFLPFIWAINLTYITSFFLAGIGSYLLARSWKINRLASLFSAIIFTFSGFNIMQITHISLLQAASFLPLILWLTELYIQKTKLKTLLFMALVLSQQIFMGHQQMTAYTIIIIYLYLFLRLFFIKEKLKKKLIKLFYFIVGISFAVTVALVLAAAILLSSYELFKLSVFQGEVDNLSLFPYPPEHFLAFINPFLFGTPQNGSYPLFSSR